MAHAGLRFVRRTHAEGYHYFIVNQNKETFDDTLPLAVPFQSAVILDPWSESRSGISLPEKHKSGNGVKLRLEPGESIIIRTFTERKIEGAPWKSFPADGRTVGNRVPQRWSGPAKTSH